MISEEEIEKQLKKSRRQTKDERYEYINKYFNQTNYAMKLEKHALKLHKENQSLKDRIEKAIEYINQLLSDEYGVSIYVTEYSCEYEPEWKDKLLEILKGDK